MRNILAIFLLSIYGLAVLRPAIPLIDYWLRVDHYKAICINKNVLEKKCHGQCHLHANLAEANDESDPATPSTSVKLTGEDFLIFVFDEDTLFLPYIESVKPTLSLQNMFVIGSTALSDIFHPPCRS